MDNQLDNQPGNSTNPVNLGVQYTEPNFQPVAQPQPQPQFAPQPVTFTQDTQLVSQSVSEPQIMAQPVTESLPPASSMTAAYPEETVNQQTSALASEITDQTSQHPDQQSQPVARSYDINQQTATASVMQPGTPISTEAPQKYKIFQAVIDTLKAAKQNLITLFVTGLIAYIIAIILISLIVIVLLTQVVSHFNIFSISGGLVIGGLVGGLVLYTLWYALAYAFVLAVTAISLRDGAQKRKGEIGETLKKSLRLIKRVALANMIVALVLIWPIVIISFTPLLLLSSSGGRQGAAIFSLVAGLVAIVWAIIGSLRYSLVPYVAIFEPEVPITKTLKRSKVLLQKGGQWFIVKGLLLILLIVLILGAVTGKNLQELNSASNIGINIIMIIVSAIASGCLVMLYLNRKAVKG